MDRIKINETDLTANVQTDVSTEVVYVPGFAWSGDGVKTSTVTVAANTPTLCSNVREFIAYFGTTPPKFLFQQYYPVASASAAGFPSVAIPANTGSDLGANAWFTADDVDPGWIYAYELLTAGISVLYDRLNTTDVAFMATPLNWGTFSTYAVNDYALKTVDSASHLLRCITAQTPTIVAEVTTGSFTVEIDTSVFATKMVGTETTSITFTYTSSKWHLNSEEVSLLDYGITVTGSPAANNVITVSGGVTYSSTNWEDLGLASIYARTTDYINPGYDVSVTKFYQTFPGRLESTGESETAILTNELLDLGTHDFKYVTSGGYPTFEYGLLSGTTPGMSLATKMINFCAERGDCYCMIDHTDNPERSLIAGATDPTTMSVYASAQSLSDTNGVSAIFTPFGLYSTSFGNIDMPASFGYLKALTYAAKTSPTWLPMSGAARGFVPGLISLNTNSILTNRIADYYQADLDNTSKVTSINAITNIKSVGYCVWGNRTTKQYSSGESGFALEFINIRNLVCDVKKRAYVAAQACLFEQNTDTLWVKFKSKVTSLLDKMVSGSILKTYRVIRNSDSSKTKITATIILYPIYSVESVEVTVYLTDEDITIE